MKEEFVHLHNHTEYSLLDGMLRLSGDKGPSKFLLNAAAGGVKAMAITDHGNMYGAQDFYKNVNAAKMKPIVGCEAYYTADHTNRDPANKKLHHITLLAKDYDGYKNLMRLISTAFVDGFYHKPRIDKGLLAKHSNGLIALSGCVQGHVPQVALKEGIEKAAALAKEYEDIMGKGNYYIELMDHGIAEEITALKMLKEVSRITGIPMVATNDCHYEKREDYKVQEVQLCIGTVDTLSNPDRFKMDTQELYFKSAEEMAQLFSHTPEAIKNTLEIAEKCNLVMPKTGFILPHFDIPKEYTDQNKYFADLCQKGLEKKIGSPLPPEYKERLDYELGVISKMGFASYFLIVADFIDYARAQHIPVGPGRGSGAGSIVAYSLNITKVDPIVNKLLFERFLNPDRLTMPDLDIDFSDSGREQVIEYVRNKYGRTNVAQIITFGSMKAKLAVKDVARALGVSVADSNRITKMISNDLGTTIESAIEQSKDLQNELKNNPQTKEVFEYAKQLEGLKRHSGIHAAGIVVTREEVFNYAPLARGSKEAVTTQYEGETLVDLGLLKIDFLGLRTLTVIENAVKLIKQIRGIDIDIDKIPLDDKKTYELFASGRTLGIFQLESSGMRELVKSLNPSQFSDISALVALYRPGPMENNMHTMFVNRKWGREKVKYDHPILEPILKETYGTMVYQEQIMEISKQMGGFTPGEADSLRKAMGKKNEDLLRKSKTQFVEGAVKKGVKEAVADKIFEQMFKFAGYGFNKSHSVAYALVSYQTAYLKANYPVEFMCAALTNEIGHNAVGSEDKENKIVTYIEEARRMGYETLPPDVNKSETFFSVEAADGKEYIRFALEALKNMGAEAALDIIRKRKDAPFTSLNDMISRTEHGTVNKRCVEALIKGGAMDGFSEKDKYGARADLLANMESVLEFHAARKQEKAKMAGGLFGDALEESVSVSASPQPCFARPLTESELLEYEKEVLGFYFSGHPLDKYSRHIAKLNTLNIRDIFEKNLSGKMNVLGLITRVKKRLNKRNEEWAQFVLEDETGAIPANIFSRAYSQAADKVNNGTVAFVSGEIKAEDIGSPNMALLVNDVKNIASLISASAKTLTIKIPQNYSRENLQQLSSLLGRAVGVTDVYLEVETPSGTSRIKTDKKIIIHKLLIEHIENTISAYAWDFEK